MVDLQLLPFASALGCIPVGYIYSIKLKVTNMSPHPHKLKISCDQPSNEPNKIKHNYMPLSLAPGMSKAIQLELHATVVKTARYEVVILQDSMERTIKELKLFICDTLQYKSISNTLCLANKRPYEDCVSIVGRVAIKDGPYQTNKSTAISTALIGDDEMEEISTMPIVGSAYWDPQTQQLFVDPELNKVFVELDSSVEKSKIKTDNHRRNRRNVLENMGMITSDALQQENAIKNQALT